MLMTATATLAGTQFLRAEDATQVTPLPKAALAAAVRSTSHLLTKTTDSAHVAMSLAEHSAVSAVFFDLFNEFGHDSNLVRWRPPEHPTYIDPRYLRSLVLKAGVHLPEPLWQTSLLQTMQPEPITSVAQLHHMQVRFVQLLHQQAAIKGYSVRWGGARRPGFRFVDEPINPDRRPGTSDTQAKTITEIATGFVGSGTAMAGFGFAAGESSLAATVGAGTAYAIGTAGIGLIVIGVGLLGYAAYEYFSQPPATPQPQQPQNMDD